ncbi:WW domain-binding protein 4-like [Anneissia japonica]|uniref:WW domain-binding protein 4-like n=1 Tax=Anneissia japonica TaxID=1529436 RepID=UPI0014255DFE|nr:WW domain-binding protein 4-like [Anneissia japonica]
MATFWKSQPKKFCDFCKCWIADNKASVDFHERGKKHKENVEKRIDELRKKGLQRYKEEESAKSSLAAIEAAALKAFEKDVKNDPSLASQYGIEVAAQFKQKQLQDQAKKDEKEEQKKVKEKEKAERIDNEKEEVGTWMEATSEEGYTYYWNTVTMNTTWETPANYVRKEDQDVEEESTDTTKNENDGDDLNKGEKRKAAGDAYGQWQTVEVRNEDPVDLQLPESANYTTSMYRPKAAENQAREKLQFKEKTVKSLEPTDSEAAVNIGFKKRKFNAGSRKIRQRDES